MPTISVLIKPASGMCNMQCDYCFYCDEMKKRSQDSYGFMSEQTLKNVIRKTMIHAEGLISYVYQGGEPTLRGLTFFEKAVEYQRHYNKHGIRVNNALQTNGYLLDDAWCKFFKENQFLIGLSIDGTKQLHDMYRHDKNGNPTFDRIKSAADLMDQYGVDYNILTVVTQNAAYHATEIYNYYKSEELSLFFPDERMRDKVEPYYRGYHEIAEFYRSFYGNDKMGKMTLFFLPDIGEDFGGYKRDGLIVFTAVKEDIPSALHHIAHELAHSYAMGADCYSWEDWLNETHAEWSALLYELEKDEAFFEHCLAKTRKRYGDRKLALKENGEEHQEFVHEAGVLVYEKIYRRYGADSIRTILRTFDHLSEKSTAKLLERLTADGEEKLACMIESYC